MESIVQVQPPPCYEEETTEPVENFPRTACKKLGKWFSNQQNAGLFASVSGIAICAVSAVIHIVLFHVEEPAFCFVSGIFFFFAFFGLKKKYIRLLFIFLLVKAIELVILSLYIVFLIAVLIFLPDAWKPMFWRPKHNHYPTPIYLPYPRKDSHPLEDPHSFMSAPPVTMNMNCGPNCFMELTVPKLNSDTDLRFEIGYRALGFLLYLVVSFLIYWIIWRAYKNLRLLKQRRTMPPATFSAVCNPTVITQNRSIIPTPDQIPHVAQPSYAQQNHSSDWPTFFNYQKNIEAERNIFRTNR
ncbi:hypothetical protein DdX_12053 [Ditylenchus destructor]|uniref:Uncharacterized protein n=1 Tax=Ditylenchus destructor TaxID=166010 RepID=A0AAD4MVU9_9BILA|nr:hypothetical protein DdX_12053 [Ditylenchus destructor]